MITEEVLQRVMNAPSPAMLAAAGAVSAGLLLLGWGLLGFSRWRGLGLGLSGLGLCGGLVALALVDAQTDVTREGPNVLVARSRFSPRPRAAARAALIALPIVASIGALGFWATRVRRLRARVPGLIKSGRAHLLQNQPDAALADFERAVEFAPHLGEAYSGRGHALHALGERERALADFDRAIGRDSRLAAAYLQRGKIQTELRNFDAALEDFNRLLSLRGPDAEIYLNRGICLFKQGRPDEAALDFQRVLKLTNHSDFADPAREWLSQIAPMFDGPAAFDGPTTLDGSDSASASLSEAGPPSIADASGHGRSLDGPSPPSPSA